MQNLSAFFYFIQGEVNEDSQMLAENCPIGRNINKFPEFSYFIVITTDSYCAFGLS